MVLVKEGVSGSDADAVDRTLTARTALVLITDGEIMISVPGLEVGQDCNW